MSFKQKKKLMCNMTVIGFSETVGTWYIRIKIDGHGNYDILQTY